MIQSVLKGIFLGPTSYYCMAKFCFPKIVHDRPSLVYGMGIIPGLVDQIARAYFSSSGYYCCLALQTVCCISILSECEHRGISRYLVNKEPQVVPETQPINRNQEPEIESDTQPIQDDVLDFEVEPEPQPIYKDSSAPAA